MLVQPYLFFEGRCEEAAELYKRAVGAEVVMMMRFKDAPPPESPPPEGACAPTAGTEEKIMHMSMRIGETLVMMSDGRCTGKPDFQGFSLSVSVPDAASADRVFNALAEGGQVLMPLGKTFYSPRFGMTADRFGVMWMVIVPEH
ncbi:bleomycin resistance protein [Cupriavidus basilensis OR16]|uniref:Bleomycin resistance protein n=1 Tax=Cupriavidus basilensis OR16 TaxID=1127483 RepID=H1S255_9BURK|nr:VOC family protein [Cupriavidus basilensis]EHP43421.1 bleomycin resistance protein [Cupriavidus basilensis OR16]